MHLPTYTSTSTSYLGDGAVDAPLLGVGERDGIRVGLAQRGRAEGVSAGLDLSVHMAHFGCGAGLQE
eukprot:scaffold91582_cov54-Phaeocystis_antarctica.AAC.7